MYALQFSKTFKLLFLKIDSFNVSDYDYEMLLVQGLVAENYVNVKKTLVSRNLNYFSQLLFL